MRKTICGALLAGALFSVAPALGATGNLDGDYFFSEGRDGECGVRLSDERTRGGKYELHFSRECSDIYPTLDFEDGMWSSMGPSLKIYDEYGDRVVSFRSLGDGLFMGWDKGTRYVLRSGDTSRARSSSYEDRGRRDRRERREAREERREERRDNRRAERLDAVDIAGTLRISGQGKAACSIELSDKVMFGYYTAKMGSDCGVRYSPKLTHLRKWSLENGRITLIDAFNKPILTFKSDGRGRWRSDEGYTIRQ